MEIGSLLFLLILLACPLMMVWMMRGHSGHGGPASHGDGHGHTDCPTGEMSGSLEELRRMRAELDVEIAQLEHTETKTKTPAAV